MYLAIGAGSIPVLFLINDDDDVPLFARRIAGTRGRLPGVDCGHSGAGAGAWLWFWAQAGIVFEGAKRRQGGHRSVHRRWWF